MALGQKKAFFSSKAYVCSYKEQNQSNKSESQASQFEYYAVRYLKYKIHVPVNKQQAVSFAVHPSVSLWAQYMLRSQGWQLVRTNPGEYSHQGRGFQVKEEEVNQPYVFDSSEERRNRHSKLNIFKSMPPMKVNESENIFQSSS